VPYKIAEEALDPDAVKTLRRMIHFGHTSYLVGGCVRDLVLGRQPKDFDISTTARPRQVRRYFRNSRVVGRRFRLAHVIYGDKVIEVSTFRAHLDDGASDEDDDASAPEPVEPRDLLIRRDNVFGGPEDDARRRDFTINGLFYDIDESVIIDHVGGMEDLTRRVIRTIGDPEVRFPEDPVRILRAIKFAARLDFAFDSATFQAMRRHRKDILRCAAPRVLEEIQRMLRGGCGVRTFDLLIETSVLEIVLPEMAEVLAARPEQLDLYRRGFAVLDHMVHDGYEPTAAILFGLLYFPVTNLLGSLSDPSHERWRESFVEFESMMEAAARRLSLPRKDFGRLHQAAALQRRLAPGPRKRRFSRAAVARQPCFEEALILFRIHAESTGHWTEEMIRWQEAFAVVQEERRNAPARGIPPNGAAAAGAPSRGDGAPAASRFDADPSHRPAGRRRRRRRHRGHGSSEGAAERTPPA
jgi:poly(A) polymerase